MAHNTDEWLEADGLGGYASGTVSTERTRRYHAILLTSRTPPTSRFVLVNGFDAEVHSGPTVLPLSRQRYTPDVVSPDGDQYLRSFSTEPWPTWIFGHPSGLRIRQELFVVRGHSGCVLRWTLLESASADVSLRIRALMSGRDYHALHRENPEFRFDPTSHDAGLLWQPYDGVPAIQVWSNGHYEHHPDWYWRFQYTQEQERGMDFMEDLASPGWYTFELQRESAALVLTDDGPHAIRRSDNETALQLADRMAALEGNRRRGLPSPLHRAAESYLVRRGTGHTIIAGYPWFTDWGRDTFIALRGLCLATGQMQIARSILLDWAETVSQGMIPNRFPDGGDDPEYNSVDASLWFIVAVHDYLLLSASADSGITAQQRARLRSAVLKILTGYFKGTRFGIRTENDGLLAAGVPGVQLTWMDAKVDDWVVTPRIGKPVEVQALWINALWIGSQMASGWQPFYERARAAFHLRYWNEARDCLFDVIDCDHVAGKNDESIRPNQILAVGGLPLNLLNIDRGRRVVEVVAQQLLTPAGLRSLSQDAPDYQPTYRGGVLVRDAAYHQGTSWLWLTGPFVEAWLRVHGDTPGNRRTAERRFLTPLLNHLQHAGINHLSEIADGDPPHTPRGCPFQAWSLGELLRLQQLLQCELKIPGG